MLHITKKQMLESYPEVTRQNDLLGLYLYDTQLGRKPDAVETERDDNGKVRVQLWRATGASGGYVVICMVGCNANIALLDAANDSFRGCYDNYTLPTRLCLERLTVLRNKLCDTISHTDTLSHTSADAL